MQLELSTQYLTLHFKYREDVLCLELREREKELRAQRFLINLNNTDSQAEDDTPRIRFNPQQTTTDYQQNPALSSPS